MSELKKIYGTLTSLEGPITKGHTGKYWYFADNVDALLVEKDAGMKEVRRLLDMATELGTELDNLFDIQQTRMGEATKLWQEATGETETLPDLGELLDWLMERGTDAEAKVKQLEKNLKKAMNDLRDMSNIKYQFAPAYLFIDMANKALADIEGEPYRHQGVSSDHTGASNQPEQIHGEPDWEEIKKRKDNDMAKALLHLRDKLSKLENTVEDIQAWIIKNG